MNGIIHKIREMTIFCMGLILVGENLGIMKGSEVPNGTGDYG